MTDLAIGTSGALRPSRLLNVKAAATGTAIRSRTVSGVLLGVFCLVIASPNLPTALLPDYRQAYGLTPFGLSLVFAGYLAVLVPALLLCTRGWFRRHSSMLLVAGLATAIGSSVVMAFTRSATGLVIGRGLAGLSVGLATGAAAALVVSVTGERGRGSVATGNLIGGLFGTLAAVLLAAAGHGEQVYLWHAGICAIAMILLIPTLLRISGRHLPQERVLASSRIGVPTAGRVALPPPVAGAEQLRRETFLGTVAGAISWTVPGIVLALLPALLRNLTGPSGILLATSPVLVFLGAAWAIQLVARIPQIGSRIRGQEVTIGIVVCGFGLILIALCAVFGIIWLAYLGALLAAAGPALAYRGGMVLCTRGMNSAAQGAATSRYAAISYGVSAMIVIGCGAIGAGVGIENGVAAGCVIMVAAAATLVVVIRRMERRTH